MKGQIKLFESIAVMVVFAFILVFGVNFYFGMQKTSLDRELARANQLHVFGLAQKTAFLPELDCAIAGIQQEACVDVGKLQAFAEVFADPTQNAGEIYFPVFGWSTVKVYKIYPPGSSQNVTLYDNALPGATSLDKVQVPVLLYNATSSNYGTYAFGYIEVTYYAK